MKKNETNIIQNPRIGIAFRAGFQHLFTSKMLRRVHHGMLITLMAMTMAVAFASCSNSLGSEEKNESLAASTSPDGSNGKAVVKVSVNDEIAKERTILPVFAKSALTGIKLYGKSSTEEGTLSASDTYLLKSWDTFADLAADEGVILDSDEKQLSGTWSFILTAYSNGSAMNAESGSAALSTTEANTVSFTLAAVSGETKGAVKVDLDNLEKKNIVSVKYNWSTSQSVLETTAAELAVSTDSIGSRSAVFEKSDVDAGNYFLTFYFYDSDNALVASPYQTSVIVQAGAISYKELTTSSFESNYTDLKTFKITYMFNNGSDGNDRCVKEFYPASVLPGEEICTGKAPEGKKFRGWNTSADGSGTRYSPGDSMDFDWRNDLLYAQWAPYDEANKVWTISSADEFRAFFSYSENGASTYGSSDYSVKLLTDITDLTDWEAVSYSGTFDGNSKSLTYTSKSVNYASLFATLSGTVKNLTLTGLSIDSDCAYVAGLASIASGATVSGVALKNSTITADRTTHLGGLIAYAKDTTTSGNSVIGTEDSPVIVTGEEAQYAGGIVGYAENCTFGSETSPDKVTLVKVIANDSSGNNQGTGAFAGYIKNSSIISPEVTYASATGRYAGGIAGQTEALSMGSEDYVISGAKVKSNESYQISGQWAGGIAGINEGCILNPVVNTVYVSADSHGGQAGGIAGENLGTITSTLASANVDFALISGNDSNYYIFTSLGGAAGENKGTISGIKVGANTKITSTKEGQLYAGGIAGYNEYESYYGFVYPGKIDENNSVEKITIDCTGGRYGYVVGMNKLGDVSDDIKNAYSESTSVSEANNGSTSASEISSKSSYVPITLTRTSKVTLTVTDASGGAAVYGGIATSSDADIDVSETNSTVLAYTGKTDGTTVTVSAGYLTEGTYYIVLQSSEDSWNLSAEGNSVTYTID